MSDPIFIKKKQTQAAVLFVKVRLCKHLEEIYKNSLLKCDFEKDCKL